MGHWYGDKIGPNYGSLLRMVKRVFDPTDTANPDRLIFMQPPEKDV